MFDFEEGMGPELGVYVSDCCDVEWDLTIPYGTSLTYKRIDSNPMPLSTNTIVDLVELPLVLALAFAKGFTLGTGLMPQTIKGAKGFLNDIMSNNTRVAI